MKKTAAKRKRGRPKGETPPLSTVAFRADGAVMAALEKLTTAAVQTVPGLAPPGARAVAIRRALLESAARLDGKGETS